MTKAILFVGLILFATLSEAQTYTQYRRDAALASEHGDFAKAIQLMQRAIDLANKDKSLAASERLLILGEQASYYVLNENVEVGEKLFKEVFSEANKTGLELPELHLNYGLSLLFLGYYSEAEVQLRRALALDNSMERLKPEDRLSCIQGQAVCEQYRYDFIQSERSFEEAEAYCRKHKLHKTNRWAELQSRKALLYVDMQLLHKALDCYAQADAMYRSGADTLNPPYAVFLLEYGAALSEAYEHERALRLTFKALHLDKLIYGEQSFAYAADLNNVGFIYNRMNRLPEAEQFYKKSLAVKKQLSYQRLDSYLSSLNNLMVFYANSGRETEAMELAAEIEKALAGTELKDTLKRAVFANNLAIHYKDWGKFQKSQHFFKECLTYYQAVYGKDNLFEAQVYMDMGTLFTVENKWEDVHNSLRRAADIYAKNPTQADLNTIGTLCNLAIILKEINQPDEGNGYAKQALQLTEQLKVTQHDILEQVYITNAQLAADLQRVQESMDYFNRYLDLKYQQLEQQFSYMTENEKLFFLEEFERDIRNYYSVILNNIKDYPDLIKALLDFRLKTKSLLLNNLGNIYTKARASKDSSLANKLSLWRLKRESFTKLMNFNTDAYPDALRQAEQLKQEADQLEKEISYAMSGNTMFHEKTPNWKQIQALLKPGEAAVEIFQSYLVYDNNQGTGTNYTFLMLRDKGEPQVVSIDRPANWEAQVLQSYRNSVSRQTGDPSLYTRLWQMVGDQLKDCHTLYVSPDGVFNQINLNTLYHAQTGKFVIEETGIHMLSSLRQLENLKQRSAQKPQNAVLLGNPRFDEDLAKTAPQEQSLLASATRGAYGFVMSELPGTKTEIEAIRKTLTEAGVTCEVLSEEHATEKRLKAIRKPGLLHIATHGFFLEDARDEDLAGYAKLEKDYYKNPMLRSGIFLTGSNHTYSISTENYSVMNEFEDGMLTAYEAMALDLQQTELVVLSACETGLGKVKNGEGVFGLQRAFKLAGAASTMMSLWAVDDEATKELMRTFYQLWMAENNLFDAFRKAQLKLKQQFAAPLYWGAFVLMDR